MNASEIPSPVRPTAASRARHSGAHPPRRPGGVAGHISPLSRAVAAALHHLADLTGADRRAAFVGRGRIDRMLREAVDRHPERGDRAGAGAAVRVACAYLLAGDTEDAYLALLTARDMLA